MVINLVVVEISKKDFKKLPEYIQRKFRIWVEQVETLGIGEVRKSSGWHDEALRGNRKGQRSIRLNRAYRAIYIIENGEIVVILEAHKHEY